jgi:hypothetical protein
MTPAAEYQARLETRRREVAGRAQASARLSAARFVTGAAGVFVFWLVFVHHGAAPLWMLAPVAVFLVLAGIHERTLRALGRTRRGEHYYARALARLDGSWQQFGETGAEFLDPHHPYAASLDLFGPGSLFQLLSSARTRAGEQVLARWLLSPAPPAEVQARQQAVADLKPRLDLREELFLLGDDIRAGVHPEELARWGAAPPVLPGRAARIAAFILPGFTLAGIAVWAYSGSRILFLTAASAQALLAFSLRPLAAHVLDSLAAPARELQLIASLLRRIESEPFEAPLLANLSQRFAAQPWRHIQRLARLVEFAAQRNNAFFAPIAAILMWSVHFAWAIEAWRAAHGSSIARWLEALGEFEALSSLAAYAAGRPEDPFPAIQQGPLLFDGEDLAHPLLRRDRAVPNSIRLDAAHPLIIISGSNMSGKSTLLRTAGVNAVLAFAGAPVRAARLTLTPFAIGASIRVVDSLQEGSSRFFAEITQLRRLVDLARGPVPLLFLLDEILSGTNSHDRRIGAAAILGGLLRLGAAGLVTTHDLALTRIAESVQPPGINLHFEDHLAEGRIVFDYRIRPGVVAKSNALALMRSIGLDVDPDAAAPL